MPRPLPAPPISGGFSSAPSFGGQPTNPFSQQMNPLAARFASLAASQKRNNNNNNNDDNK